jgi:phage shock protein PspC (stress-responsive transcriptional regulator)
MVFALSQAEGQSLALIITFGGIGVLATLIVAYVIAQVLAERKENQERQQRL